MLDLFTFSHERAYFLAQSAEQFALQTTNLLITINHEDVWNMKEALSVKPDYGCTLMLNSSFCFT